MSVQPESQSTHEQIFMSVILSVHCCSCVFMYDGSMIAKGCCERQAKSGVSDILLSIIPAYFTSELIEVHLMVRRFS